MKKVIKIIISAAGVLFLAVNMFINFIGGMPSEDPKTYVFLAACFSLLMPLFLCLCIHYIFYLQKKLEEKEDS